MLHLFNTHEMNDIKYIIRWLSICFLCLLSSCSDEMEELGSGLTESAYLDGDKVVLRGSVTFPREGEMSTRALGADFNLANLHLYIAEFADANDPLSNNFLRLYEASEENVIGDQVNFSVTMRSTALPRVLHLIALPKGEKLKLTPGIEAVSIPSLTVSNGVEAYWRRLKFPNGYCVETAGTWEVDPELKSRLTRVPLIRNFCKFSMVNEEPDFTLLGFQLVNTPSQGSVAAWNPASMSFIDFLNASGEPNSYTAMSAIYPGLYPANTTLGNQVPATGGIDIPDNASSALYMYERPFDENARTYIILKGRRNGNSNTFYYKIDIGKKDSDGIFRYLNLLRNFNYKIIIKDVTADGYSSSSEAAQGTVFNNISFDVELEKLTNMSDGSEIVYVDFTSFIFTSTTSEEVTFRYRYKNIANGNFNNSGTKLVDFKAGSVIQSVGTPVTDGTFQTVTFTLRPATAETKVQKFIVIKPTTGLGRTVTLISHLKWDIGTILIYPKSLATYNSNTPNVNALPAMKGNKTIGNPFTLFFDLPTDLPEVVFPLEFILESQQQIMENEPGTGVMAVQSGPSLFGSNTAIQYKREVTWTEYNLLRAEGGIKLANGKRRVVCNFRTTKPVTNGTNYRFRISNVNFYNKDIVTNTTVNLQ